MKKIYAFTLLVIYLNAAAQPLLPWVTDVLAHTFNWKHHLEHVHFGHIHSHHVALEVLDQYQGSDKHPVAATFFFQKDVLSAHVMPAIPVPIHAAPAVPTGFEADWCFLYRSIIGDVIPLPPNPHTGGLSS